MTGLLRWWHDLTDARRDNARLRGEIDALRAQVDRYQDEQRIWWDSHHPMGGAA